MARSTFEKPDRVIPESSKDREHLTPEDGTASKKRGGLLPVPSRSSSQRIQSSPTTTGLSGATAGDPRDSIGGHSKESKGSMLGRNRNGSASSNRLGVGTGPTATPGNSEPSSPAVASHKKKKGGFLAIFGCCGVPDNANGLDTDAEVPNHRLEKIPPRPATASRRTATPSDQPSNSRTQLYEKENTQPLQVSHDSNKNGKRVSGTSTQDQSTVGDRDAESKQTTLVGPSSSNPVISVEPPHVAGSDAETVEEAASEKDAEGDVPMPDAGVRQQSSIGSSEDTYTSVPPPPPGPVPAVPNPPTTSVETPLVFPPEQPQKFLLPPQAPEFKGKKCLVLDLDETLVHSSFKVGDSPPCSTIMS